MKINTLRCSNNLGEQKSDTALNIYVDINRNLNIIHFLFEISPENFNASFK